ncbi:MAG TPA: tetratricopeptide repeat protein [Elusimicrobiales bacterium]|nr:tetratricopeptide repeat protein [Elusimicrobiales bacterium]
MENGGWLLNIPDVPRYCEAPGLKKSRIDIGDAELYYEEEGAGVPIVLLHGGPGATHHAFHPWFSRAAEFARVIYYDQRGCGLSDHKDGGRYSSAQAVDDLEKLRLALKIDRWIVAGHSYGGYLAQHYAVKYPDHLAALVLVGAKPAVGLALGTRQGDYLSAEERHRISSAYRDKSLTPELQLFNAHFYGDWKRQNFYRPSVEDLARMVRYEWVHDPLFRGTINTAMPDLRGFFSGSPVPVLIMEGKWDLTWSADKPEKMAAHFPGAELRMFLRSSHSPFADEPELFFSVLKDFAAGLPKIPDDALGRWKSGMEVLRRDSPAYIIGNVLSEDGWGAAGSAKLSAVYRKEWLDELPAGDCDQYLLRLGFALYDGKRYEDALETFKKFSAPVWEGQMNDLLGRRKKAVRCYRRALKKGVSGVQHGQYGIELTPDYVRALLQEPFVRIENSLP